MENNTAPSEDLLQNFEEHLVRADAGKRLANYIIDAILFYVFMFCLGMVMGIMAPTSLEVFDAPLVGNILAICLYALFMFAQEAIFKGRSLGKLITGTRAVNLDGSPINSGKALQRGFSRAVPFCAFSALGTPCNPWQDRWTDTMVIDEKKSMKI